MPSVPITTEEFKSHSWGGVLDTTLCDQVCHRQWQVWFSLGTPVSSTNKTDRHNITEILLKVVLNTIALTLPSCVVSCNPFINSLHPDDHKMSCILNSSRLKNIRTGNSFLPINIQLIIIISSKNNLFLPQ
jgi:hypothetical protein